MAQASPLKQIKLNGSKSSFIILKFSFSVFWATGGKTLNTMYRYMALTRFYCQLPYDINSPGFKIVIIYYWLVLSQSEIFPLFSILLLHSWTNNANLFLEHVAVCRALLTISIKCFYCCFWQVWEQEDRANST